VVVLACFLYARLKEWPEAEARALGYAALVIGIVGLALANRSWTRIQGRPRNPIMLVLLLAAPALLAAIVYVPWIARFFRLEALRAGGLAVVGVGFAVSLLWAFGTGLLARSRVLKG
jgi:uncharacterized protein YjeT (DUF2065 family)